MKPTARPSEPDAAAAPASHARPAERHPAPLSAKAKPSPVTRVPLPALRFPEALPVSGHAEVIARAIRESPVVIVCGETGSGKTTQLPKICALAGRGQAGLIGHTQPRRIAATSVAARIAEELGSPLGTHVGYKIRFGERFSPGATIKLMTDGVLLAETQSDPRLRQYDTIIVDEAHERSLNIDFLLGYLKRLLEGPRRHDLRVVITSATIDAQRFAAHFAIGGRPAPVIEVSGRLYPVEIRYQGFDDAHRDDDDETDLPSRIDEAIETLWREAPGDVLVFLPGEREIRDVADHLRRLCAREQAARSHSPWARGAVEILPLYSRLAAADQQRIFSGSTGRRIVLATNVAETSLTVPGIRYVVDSGVARVKRYRYRGKVEQLQIEPVSQAAANQRAGRCGRVADGVCIRLFDQADFEARPRFTDPEVLRSSLAAVILRMKALRLEDIEAFPFLDPPPRRAVADGLALLSELGAIDEQQGLTPIGQKLARLPVDPRIGRMLLEAAERRCLRELLVIASALSVQDPRERPMDAQQAADQAHRRFADEHSDFLSLLKVWDYWQTAQRERESNRKFTQQLELEFLSARRLREWADVHSQLAEAVRENNWTINAEPATPEAVHRALLAGLLGNLGTRPPDEASYAGTHQVRFAIHPSSSVLKKAPRWLMAAEIVDTARTYARCVARIDPLWIEQAAGHLIQRSWSDPAWSKQSGQAFELERGMIYGLVLYSQRRVPLAQRNPSLARELLIREGLVGEGIDAKLPFLVQNRRLIAEIEKLEQKIRRPDLLVDDQFLFDWYDAKLPERVTSLQRLEQWLAKATPDEARALVLSRDQLMRREETGVASDAFPRQLMMRGASFELDYRFDPGADDDGVTVRIPVVLLNQVDPVRCEWLVPGMLRDKVQALVKSLPPRIRRVAVPIPEYAEAFVSVSSDKLGEMPLAQAILADLAERLGVRAQLTDFRVESVPAHLFMRFVVTDTHGARLGAGRNLAQLKSEFGDRAQGAFRQALSALGLQATPGPVEPKLARAQPPASVTAPERPAGAGSAQVLPLAGERHTDWSFGALPEILELEQRIDGRRQTLIGYPALIDRTDAVELAVFDDADEAAREHRRGLVRLFRIALREPLRFFERNINDFQRMSLQFAAFGSADDLKSDLVSALIARACLTEPPPADEATFRARIDTARPRLTLIGQELARVAAEVLAEHSALARKLGQARAWPAAADDMATQLAALLPKRFIVQTPWEQLRHLPRYLRAVALRIDKLREDPARDARLMAELAPLVVNFRRTLTQRKGAVDPRLEEFRWMLEELRVSLYAQTLRTPMPVSVKRLQKAWEAIRD
jgi:ATP-dependent helicase HrpA